jgi:hypothetical protein
MPKTSFKSFRLRSLSSDENSITKSSSRFDISNILSFLPLQISSCPAYSHPSILIDLKFPLILFSFRLKCNSSRIGCWGIPNNQGDSDFAI